VSSHTWYQVFIELHVVDCDVTHYSTVNTCCSVRFSTLLNRKHLNRRFPGKMQHRTLDVCCSKTEFRLVVVWDKHSYEERYFSDQTQMHSSLARIMRRCRTTNGFVARIGSTTLTLSGTQQQCCVNNGSW
jgi:hypothetical protein